MRHDQRPGFNPTISPPNGCDSSPKPKRWTRGIANRQALELGCGATIAERRLAVNHGGDAPSRALSDQTHISSIQEIRYGVAL